MPAPSTPSIRNLFLRGFESITDVTNVVYHLPPPEFFTSTQFLDEYCLSAPAFADAQRDMLAVEFRPARRRSGVVQISGTFWFHREGPLLDRLTFEYVGVPEEVRDALAGGWVEYTQVGAELWTPTRSEIRMPRLTRASVGYETSSGRQRSFQKSQFLADVTTVSVEIGEMGGPTGTVFSSARPIPASGGTALGFPLEATCAGTENTEEVRGKIRSNRGPPEAAALAVEWFVLLGPAESSVRPNRAQVRADGGFTLCGFPREQPIRLRVLDGTGALVHQLTVRIPEGVPIPLIRIDIGIGVSIGVGLAHPEVPRLPWTPSYGVLYQDGGVRWRDDGGSAANSRGRRLA